MSDPAAPGLSPEELDRLAARLEAIGNDNALSLEGVDGLFCALIASPATVLPSAYLPLILGGEPGDGGAFADHEDLQAAMSMLMRYWNSIVADLEREAIHLPFVFEPAPDEVPGREWAFGFMEGVELAPDGWEPLFNDEGEADLAVIPLVAGDVDPEWPTEPVTPELQDDVVKSMAVGVARAYQRFRGRPLKDSGAAYDRMVEADAPPLIEPYVRPAPKVGRNDPCPCGSGRKHKKCCGAA